MQTTRTAARVLMSWQETKAVDDHFKHQAKHPHMDPVCADIYVNVTQTLASVACDTYVSMAVCNTLEVGFHRHTNSFS